MRDALDPEARRAGSLRIAETILAIDALAEAEIVSAFWPIRSEVDPRPLIERLFARGQRVVLPKSPRTASSFANGARARRWCAAVSA